MRKKIMSIIIIFVMVFILVCKNTYVAMAASGDGNDIKDEDNESQEEIKEGTEEGTEEGSKEDTLLEDEIDIIPPSLSYEALDYKDIFSKKYIMGNSVRLRVNVSDDSDGEITLILYSEYFGESDNSVVTEYGRWTVSEGEQYIDIDEGMLSDAIKLKAIDESGNDNVVIVNSNEYVLDNNAPKLSIEKSDADYEEDLEGYLRYTNIDYMRDYFAGNKTSLHIFYRRKFGDEFKQVMMEIIPADDYSNDNQSLFLYVNNIEK